MRKYYDENIIKNMSLYDIGLTHKNMSKEDIERLAYEELQLQRVRNAYLVADIENKLCLEDGKYADRKYYHEKAKWIVDNANPILIQNINEWIDDTPISDIKINDVSVLDVMQQYGEDQPIHFIRAVVCMIHGINANALSKDFCFNFFA